MCDTCGCSADSGAVLRKPGESDYHVHVSESGHGDHHHEGDHDHEHGHHHHEKKSRTIALEQDVLQKNNLLAETGDILRRATYLPLIF
jgi:hydrogenase nickel incorporation protein HypB